ncbi:MAG: glycosyltransferase family 9 protein [Patescibacteria group bacterium]
MPGIFHKILIINPGGIGDLIMFSPALQILKNNFPDSVIDIFVSHTTGKTGIFQDSLIINKIFFFNFQKNKFLDKIKLILKLKKERYDLVFIASGVNHIKGSLFAFLISGKNSVGEYRKFKLPFYSHQIKLDGDLHKIEANLKILKSLGIKIENPPPPFFERSESDKQFAEEFILKNNLGNKILIGFSIGSGTAQQFKLWPKENFIELGRKILNSHQNALILLFGSSGEKNLCSEVKNYLGKNSMPAIGLTLSQVAILIDRCRIFVSSDTGLSHIAAATNTDLIAIFGPTIHGRTGPVGPRVHIILEKCRYRYHDIFTPKYDFSRKHECLKKITPEIVFNKINQILKNGNAKAI